MMSEDNCVEQLFEPKLDHRGRQRKMWSRVVDIFTLLGIDKKWLKVIKGVLWHLL